MASASSSEVKVLVTEPISYTVSLSAPKFAKDTDVAVHNRDADPVERPVQVRQRRSGQS